MIVYITITVYSIFKVQYIEDRYSSSILLEIHTKALDYYLKNAKKNYNNSYQFLALFLIGL